MRLLICLGLFIGSYENLAATDLPSERDPFSRCIRLVRQLGEVAAEEPKKVAETLNAFISDLKRAGFELRLPQLSDSRPEIVELRRHLLKHAGDEVGFLPQLNGDASQLIEEALHLEEHILAMKLLENPGDWNTSQYESIEGFLQGYFDPIEHQGRGFQIPPEGPLRKLYDLAAADNNFYNQSSDELQEILDKNLEAAQARRRAYEEAVEKSQPSQKAISEAEALAQDIIRFFDHLWANGEAARAPTKNSALERGIRKKLQRQAHESEKQFANRIQQMNEYLRARPEAYEVVAILWPAEKLITSSKMLAYNQLNDLSRDRLNQVFTSYVQHLVRQNLPLRLPPEGPILSALVKFRDDAKLLTIASDDAWRLLSFEIPPDLETRVRDQLPQSTDRTAVGKAKELEAFFEKWGWLPTINGNEIEQALRKKIMPHRTEAEFLQKLSPKLRFLTARILPLEIKVHKLNWEYRTIKTKEELLEIELFFNDYVIAFSQSPYALELPKAGPLSQLLAHVATDPEFRRIVSPQTKSLLELYDLTHRK